MGTCVRLEVFRRLLYVGLSLEVCVCVVQALCLSHPALPASPPWSAVERLRTEHFSFWGDDEGRYWSLRVYRGPDLLSERDGSKQGADWKWQWAMINRFICVCPRACVCLHVWSRKRGKEHKT